ncbi:DUF2785 domain-containing protein [Lacticaseibacillus baoqingensis]|uniref:DUF2785 domain-containing protein n=1 Tax=Lacticaseibacillus baoqingensis TaxID=2486013 RepID=A0ABW4E3K7_9LACO|nr:DUF2785 domain-containing protein [Lacticaseibacillus baoqingensis]
MDELAKTYQALQKVQHDLLAGKIFGTLPQQVGQIMDAVKPQPATPVQTPDDDEHAIARIRVIVARTKASSEPEISDDELRFLVAHLASRNPLVRDKGAFFCLGDLLQSGAVTNVQLVWLFHRLQAPDVLYSHILETQNDGIYLRSFAVMILSAVVYADKNRYHALTPDDYHDLVLPMAVYLALERDGRGYVDAHGWAHVYTHIGNLLDELTQVTSLTRGEKVFLMTLTLAGWQRIDDPLVYGEDQRIALYLTNLASKHQFYAQSLVMGLTDWQRRIRQLRPQESQRFWNRWYNRNRLLEACLMRADMPQSVVDYLQKIIDFY